MNINPPDKKVSSKTNKLFKISLPFNFDSDEIEILNNKQFSKREIDVIACLISGRTAKKTASLLCIAPKTVESHIYNIMSKLGCSTRNSIIDFIEKTGKYALIKHHYSNLLSRLLFEESLKKMALVINDIPDKHPEIHLLIENVKEKGADNFIQKMTADLKSLGLSLIVTDNRILETLSKEALEEIYSVEEILPKIQQNYYFLFFEILKRLIPLFIEKIDKLSLELREQLQDQTVNKFLFSDLKHQSSNLKEEKHKIFMSAPVRSNFLIYTIFKNQKPLFIAAIIICTLFIILTTPLKSQFFYFGLDKNKHIISDLLLPYGSTLLKRSDYIKEIYNKFNNTESIQMVVLVGTGGAGKTTLARNFARQQKERVIWEINAETKESLISSFTNLAYALSRTEEDRKMLNELKEIKQSDEREKQLLLFVKNKLNTESKWLLIYDNVEVLNNILEYFPNNSEAWGNGRVIITTRDANIKNNSHINSDNIINIKELSESEKFTLFTRILFGSNPKKIDLEQRKEINLFLKELSPHPLDISTAAYYIKDTQISYQEYLKRIKISNIEFVRTQENLLSENTDYTKTRFGIIKITLNKIIGEHPDFKELLLFISLLDSQNIPKDLLGIYKKHAIVDQFIHNLRKHSLITTEENASAFSIHRSTQEITLAYFIDLLNLEIEKNSLILQPIVDALENFITDAVEEEDLLKMRRLVVHCEKILSHKSLLSDSIKGSIQSKLGVIYSYLTGNFIKAREYLEQGIIKLRKSYSKDYLKLAWALENLGGVYERLDNYEKAKKLIEESILLYKRHSKNPIDLARSLGHLSIVYRDLGDYEKVKHLLEQSLEFYKKETAKNQNGIAWSTAYLGIACRDLGHYEKSLQLLEQSLLIYKNNFKEDHNRIGWILAWLGRVYNESGHYEKSIQFLEQSLVIKKQNFSEKHLNIAGVLGQLGNAYSMLGYFEKAKRLLEESLEIYRRYPGNHLLIAGALVDLGNLHNFLGHHQKPKDILQQSLSIMKEHSKNKIWYASIITALGVVHRDLGELEKAKEFLEQSIQIYQNEGVKNPILVAESLGHLGTVYRDLGDYEKAKELLQQNLVTFENHYGKEHIKTARVLRNIGQLYLLQGNLEVADNILKKTLEIFQKNKHSERYRDLELLADLYLKKSTYSMPYQNNKKTIQDLENQVGKYLKLALEIAKTNFPEDSLHVKRIQFKLQKE